MNRRKGRKEKKKGGGEEMKKKANRLQGTVKLIIFRANINL